MTDGIEDIINSIRANEQESYQMGCNAYGTGLQCIPTDDPALRAFVGDMATEDRRLMYRAWRKGWHGTQRAQEFVIRIVGGAS